MQFYSLKDDCGGGGGALSDSEHVYYADLHILDQTGGSHVWQRLKARVSFPGV